MQKAGGDGGPRGRRAGGPAHAHHHPSGVPFHGAGGSTKGLTPRGCQGGAPGNRQAQHRWPLRCCRHVGGSAHAGDATYPLRHRGPGHRNCRTVPTGTTDPTRRGGGNGSSRWEVEMEICTAGTEALGQGLAPPKLHAALPPTAPPSLFGLTSGTPVPVHNAVGALT